MAWFVVPLVLLGLAGCNMPESSAETTATINVTQAYQTVQARMTEAATLTPRQSTTPQPTDSGVPTSIPTTSAPPTAALLSPTAPANTQPPAASPTQKCDLAAPGNPIDVSIPDDSKMTPGQAFTKTWRLQNIGTCTWSRSYSVELFSGDQMGAPASVPLPSDVAPGQTIDISVDMTAPQAGGDYQGNWKLRNASDAWFGIGPNGDAPFWVRISVSGAVTGTATATAATATPGTPQPSPTATSEPQVVASNILILALEEQVDLDLAQVSGAGADLVYETNANDNNVLAPQGGARIGVFGTSAPGLGSCQSANMSEGAVAVANLPVGTYFCYRTGANLPGRALLSSYNPDNDLLTLEVLTWAAP